MDRIVLELNDGSARKWRYFTEEKRNELTHAFDRIIDEAANRSDERFSKLLTDIRNEAQNNGLTQDMLEKLLHED